MLSMELKISQYNFDSVTAMPPSLQSHQDLRTKPVCRTSDIKGTFKENVSS